MPYGAVRQLQRGRLLGLGLAMFMANAKLMSGCSLGCYARVIQGRAAPVVVLQGRQRPQRVGHVLHRVGGQEAHHVVAHLHRMEIVACQVAWAPIRAEDQGHQGDM